MTLYSDFRSDMLLHPIKEDLILLKDEEAVKNSIKNLMLTGPYERRFRPSLGAGLQKYLFENISPQTAIQIRTAIITTIKTYETRCELLDVNVQINPDYNSYSASILFRISSSTAPVSFTTILERIR